MEDQRHGPNAMPLDGLTAGVDHLEAVVVFLFGQGTAYASWARPTAQIDAPNVAAAFRDAYVAAAVAAARLSVADATRSGASSARPATITVEEGDRVAFIHRVRAFGVAIVFDKEAPLGLARAHAQKIARTLEHELPLDAAPTPSPAPPPVRIGSIGPVSQAAVTMMTPTLSATAVAEELPPETSPAPRVQVGGDDVGDAAPLAERTPLRDEPTSSSSDLSPEHPAERRDASDSDAARPRSIPVPSLSLMDPGGSGVDGADVASSRRPSDVTDTPPEGRAIRLLAYVEATSIEPHISLLRLALRSGLGLTRLRDPRQLTPADLVLLETAAEEMLGLERGKLVERIRAAVPVIPLPARGAP